MTANYIILSFIILVIIAAIIFLVSSIRSRNTYLKYLKTNLPTVAENIINDIIEKKITIKDISIWNSDKDAETEIFLVTIEYIKDGITKYILNFIDENVKNKFVAKLLKDIVTLDPSIISEAIDVVLDSSNTEGKKIYNNLLNVVYDHVTDRIKDIDKEEAKAAEIAEAYENETVEDVAEYNGEYDKSEYDIARENFETKEIEYPDEENLDDIPEELVEIVENSEEEIILEDQSDGEQLIFDDEEIDN